MTSIAMTFELPKTQDALTRPEKWNNDWETLLKTGFTTPKVCLGDMLHTWRNGIDEVYHSYSILYTSTCEVQWRVGKRAMIYLDELEPAWNASTKDERRKHLLIGMSTACSKARNLNDARAYCPNEIRLDKLSRTPAAYLDLLRSLILDDLSKTPETPYYIPSQEWESLQRRIERTGTDMEKICVRHLIILRTKLIYFVVEFTFLSFLGQELPEVTVMKSKGPVGTPAMSPELMRAVRELHLGKSQAKKVIKEDRNAQRDRARQREVICTGCGKQEGPGEAFQRCQRCNDRMQRYEPYCSRDCQVRHWKVHKITCGKHLDLETTLASSIPKGSAKAAALNGVSENAPLQVGPPINGYKRSLSLKKHILYLNDHPTVDLLIRVGPKLDNTLQIDIPFPPIQKILRATRDLAMLTGDRNAVAKICHWVVWFFVAKGLVPRLDMDCIAEQMAKEFEYPELKDDVLKMQERYFQDPFRRPPLLADANLDPQTWKNFLVMDPPDMDEKIVFSSSEK